MPLTTVLLAEDLGEYHGILDGCFPCVTLERKDWFLTTLCHWRKLEEIACNNELSHLLAFTTGFSHR